MKFYVVRKTIENLDAETEFLFASDFKTADDAPRCPVCGDIIGMLPILPPIRVELEAWGKKWGDMALGTGGGGDFLVSERAKAIFEENRITGLAPYRPAEVVRIRRRKRKLAEPPKYFLVTIARSRAGIDDAASGVERTGPLTCSECYGPATKRIKRVILLPGTWSGEDVFEARGLPGVTLVSERFKSCCEDFEITNCPLEPAEEHSYDLYPWEEQATKPDRK